MSSTSRDTSLYRTFDRNHPPNIMDQTAAKGTSQSIIKEASKHNPLSRKRQRANESDHASTQKAPKIGSNNGSDDPQSTKQKSQFLKDRIVVVSTLSTGDTSTKNSANPSEGSMNYKTVRSLCQDAGATVTAQVHKKVFCVIATGEATGLHGSQPTQRVRKAWKKSTPVVDIEWLHRCIEAKRLLPFDTSIIPPKESVADKCPEAESIESSSKGEPRQPEAEITVDLGCCCSCHDTNHTDCPWCIDCSVNRAKYK